MKRYGYGLGYSRNTRVGTGSPPTQIYNVNSATYNGSTSYNEAPAPVASALQIGTQEFSANIWVKSTNTTSSQMIIHCGGIVDSNYWDLYTLDDGGTPKAELRFVSDRAQFDMSSVLDGDWHQLTPIKDHSGTQNGKTGQVRLLIDGIEQTPTFTSRPSNLDAVNVGGGDDPITFGRRSRTTNLYFDGSLDFASIHVGTVITPADALTNYGTGTPKCIEDSVIESTITEAWDLGTYTGSRGALVGYKGVQDLTTEVDVTYTDQGLQVEC